MWDTANDVLRINGLYITKASDGQATIDIMGATARMQWCSIYTTDSTSNSSRISIESQGGGAEISNNIFKGSYTNTNTGATIDTGPILQLLTGTISINNNIFYGQRLNQFISLGAIGTTIATFGHCVFYDNQYLIGRSASSNNTATFENSILIKNTNLFFSTTQLEATIQYCLYDQILSSKAFTQSNNITGFLPLFYNEVGLDFRLQDQRRIFPGGTDYFAFTSKAVYNPDIGQDPSSDTSDLGPFSVSILPDDDDWDGVTWDNEYWNDKVTIELDLVNHSAFDDLRGNFHRAFDGSKRKITLDTIQNSFIGTDASYNLFRLIYTPGAKRWYPRGDDGLFTLSSSVITENADGTFNSDLSAISPGPHDAGFRGFITHLASGAANFYLRIKQIIGNNMTLEDHRENQIVVPGTYVVTCLYLPVEVDQPQTQMLFENWRPDQNPLMHIDPELCVMQDWEGNARQLTLRECEIDE